MDELRIPILPKQQRFIESAVKEVMYSGAFGAGKSRALCFKVLERASIPGNTVGLCRKTLVSLKSSTLRTLLYPDGDLPPVLPQGSYHHHISDRRIHIFGAGDIHYFGCDNPEAIGSLHGIGSVGVDESIELDEDEWIMLLGRCRNTIDDKRQLFCATNPGSPSHFLHERFFGTGRGHLNRELIQAKSTENSFLPADYIEMLNSFTGNHKLRYVDGVWVAFEGLVYGEVWDRDVHLKSRPLNTKWKEVVVGVDPGFTNPACICRWGIDGDGRMHGLRMFYKRKQLPSKLIEVAKSMNGDVYVVDPSAAGLIADFENAGMFVVPANNDVDMGIKLTMERMKVQKDGRPRLTFEPHFSEAIMEEESYSWDEKKDAPVKAMDHFQDQKRYVVCYLDGDRINPEIHSLEEEASEMKRVKKIRRPETAKEIQERLIETDAAWTSHGEDIS